MLANPCKFRCGKPRQGQIACHSAQARFGRFEFDTLEIAASIVPEYRGTQDFAACVEQRRAVHLPCEADRFNRFGIDTRYTGRRERSVERTRECVPPCLRRLFRPARMRTLYSQGGGGAGAHLAVTVEQYCFYT